MEFFELIRQVLKRKFFAVLNDGAQLADDAFDDLHASFDEYARANEVGPYRRAREGVAEEGDEQAAEVQGAEAGEENVVPPAKRRAPAMRRSIKHTPKPKALDPLDRSRARSRFTATEEPVERSTSAAPQTDDTIMEEPEEG